MKRREFVTLAGGAAAWPFAAWAQPTSATKRVAILMGLAETDAEGQARNKVFRQGLQQLGWIENANIQFDYFFALVADTALVSQASSASQSIYCATRQAGNPFSRYCNASAWREWRRRGRWDSRLDNACRLNPLYVPRGCPPRYAR